MSPENRIQRRNVYEYKVKKEEKACNPYDKGARSMYLLIEKITYKTILEFRKSL